ncbi:MAG: hypothetical protein LC713_03905 [Actinobacteria bacterium]|nr:hypothetical protein [Actinomycetota bacterium]
MRRKRRVAHAGEDRARCAATTIFIAGAVQARDLRGGHVGEEDAQRDERRDTVAAIASDLTVVRRSQHAADFTMAGWHSERHPQLCSSSH